MKKITFVLTSAVIALVCMNLVSCDLIAKQQKQKEARKAADSWIKLIDSQNYAASWETVSEAIRKSTTREDWIKNLNRRPERLGKLIQRSFIEIKQGTSDSGKDYFVIRYRSSFRKKENTIEAVALSKNSDNTWRLIGYFMKP